MLIKNIEQRIKINKIVSISTIAFAVFIVVAGFFFAYRMIEDSRKSIYILDNGVPVLAKQTDVLLNRPVEYKAQIELFHRLFLRSLPMMPISKTTSRSHCISLMTAEKRNTPISVKKAFTIRLLLPARWSVSTQIPLRSIWSRRNFNSSESR